ncbi:hypothetical protein TBLA_0H02770 [Henningerozyma blattae CBS 6284]|uniref:CWH43-like N-terminal domain-containing protein n=1 Tax=Henningerozyma blattae (strain ATCC 34711 / CBS 6284 / DSM 70876 / NBRC 10599 / NRRL Y-10934 / UCD 77-7) TaxID=1071380 RepID=I2H859_HENB6|nr:hypothetical protein TBLA_0H02770 [Tetrapisispora blattae CBS 6284]CCH62561.1 hypothetical protein TBLA_0H02770 [Tetrapisispora blattae CBS 6284]
MAKKPANLFYLLPLAGLVPWTGMLIAMLACWGAQGRPIYWFMHSYQSPVYLSDIGATNLRPLFISCAGAQGLIYVICVACEYYQRAGRRWPWQKHKAYVAESSDYKTYASQLASQRYLMPPWYTRDERNLIWAATVLAAIGELALLFCSIFSTALYHHVHLSMVGVFIAFMFLSICCQGAEYFLMGKHYALIHPLASAEDHQITFEELSWKQWRGHIWNKFTLSATCKMSWLTLAFVWAICFGCCSSDSTKAAFEWVLCFWYSFYFLFFSIDFYLGGRYRDSKYFHQIQQQSFARYYKYDIRGDTKEEEEEEEADDTYSDIHIDQYSAMQVPDGKQLDKAKSQLQYRDDKSQFTLIAPSRSYHKNSDIQVISNNSNNI